MDADKFTVELIVSNHYGVLNRITGLYAKRGYNIDSLYVNETQNPEKSRMLITSKGNKYIQTQMVRQLQKLYDVENVVLMAQVG
jgi:acetolactate synthase-1/3 small subunit